MLKFNFFKMLIFTTFISFLIISCNKDAENPVTPDGSGVTATDILNEINFARTNPVFYISLLENMKQYFDDNMFKEPGEPDLKTTEGVSAVNDAINELKGYSGINALTLSEGLSKAAADHVKDIGSNGIVSHIGSDGSILKDRISRYGKWDIICGECICYGSKKAARSVVLQLIVDDGVPDRGHRKSIYEKRFTKLGAAFGDHTKYRTCSVIDFAGKYTEK